MSQKNRKQVRVIAQAAQFMSDGNDAYAKAGDAKKEAATLAAAHGCSMLVYWERAGRTKLYGVTVASDQQATGYPARSQVVETVRGAQ